MHDLIRLYRTFNPSGYEFKMSMFVQDKLRNMGIEDFNVCPKGQIYRFTNEPLVCAHMDSVSKRRARHIAIDHEKGIIKGKTNIGADDKNGIWIALRILEKYPNLSFIFSVEEEAGGEIGSLPLEDIKSSYALIFDRKGSGDIIGTHNDYCCDDLEDNISLIGKYFGYSPCRGVFSDCDTLYAYVPCVNLSCGYYMAHTEKEYTVISELQNALDFGLYLIEHLPREEYKIATPTLNYYNYGGWTYDYSNDPDWVCMCDHVNQGKDWMCKGCGVSYYKGVVCEIQEEDSETCMYCGNRFESVSWCGYCVDQTCLALGW